MRGKKKKKEEEKEGAVEQKKKGKSRRQGESAGFALRVSSWIGLAWRLVCEFSGAAGPLGAQQQKEGWWGEEEGGQQAGRCWAAPAGAQAPHPF